MKSTVEQKNRSDVVVTTVGETQKIRQIERTIVVIWYHFDEQNEDGRQRLVEPDWIRFEWRLEERRTRKNLDPRVDDHEYPCEVFE